MFAMGSPVAGAEETKTSRVAPIEALSPAQQEKALQEFEESTKRLEAIGKGYEYELRATGQAAVRSRQRQLDSAYRRQIDDIETLEHEYRLEAVTMLEKFVRQYPNHPEHTPDAMYRLADLLFERSQVDGFSLREQYDRNMALWRRGKIPAEPEQPTEDYSESVKLYDEILRRFKDFRLTDVVLYKQAYLLNRGGKEREARDAWEKLATTFGEKSQFTAESWLRVGEYHFDNQEWRLAERAYVEASKYPDAKNYPMVLYKLAWTHFMSYDYDRAISGFKDLISRYEVDAKQGKRSVLGEALREEAIQYLARSLAEEDWNGDNEPDADAGVKRALRYLNDKTPAENAILEEYAKSLSELFQTKYFLQSAEVYRTLIERDPNSAKNPDFQEKVIEAYYQANDLDGLRRERERYVAEFGRGSAWANANTANGGVRSRVDRTIETILRQAGTIDHARAQELKASGSEREASAAYLKAAESYKAYIAEYGNRREAYEIRFLLAEALYYGGQYPAASTAYAEVRDFKKQTQYRDRSAYSAVAALEQHIGELVAAKKVDGRVEARDAVEYPPPEERTSEIRRMQPEEVPEVALEWVKQADSYLALNIAAKDTPDFPVTLEYRTGLLYYNFKNFDEARKRFESVVKKHPLKREAAFAAFNIINSYRAENDWPNVEAWSDRIAKDGIGRPEDVAAVKKQVAGFKLGQKFDRAMLLFEEQKFVEAAEEFERVVNEDPASKFMDKALYNAALAYQNAKHWNSAARVFERIATEPHFAGSQYREDSLFYMAENNRKFFAFDRSVGLYAALASSFPKSERAPYALFQAARLLEMQGNFKEAVTMYRKYMTDFSTRDDAAQALYNVGRIFERTGDKNAEIATWREFITRYNAAPGADGKIVEATLRLGDLHKAKNDWKDAERYYQQTIDEAARRKIPEGSMAAAAPAKARFELVENDFRRYERMKLSGSTANQGKILAAKRQMLNDLEAKYVEVFQYKAFDWTVASFVRVGYLYQLFAQMLYDAPDPPGLSDEDMDLFRTQIEEQAIKWENIAIERYAVAVAKARELKIVNEWSQRALKELNTYKPAEYPLFKAEKRQYEFSTDVPAALEPAPAEPAEPVGTEPEPIKVEAPSLNEPGAGQPDSQPGEPEPEPEPSPEPEPQP
jgi:TolA-binding protein